MLFWFFLEICRYICFSYLISAYDFTGKSTTATSTAVIIDNTPPERTKNQIHIIERHIKNLTALNAWYVHIDICF